MFGDDWKTEQLAYKEVVSNPRTFEIERWEILDLDLYKMREWKIQIAHYKLVSRVRPYMECKETVLVRRILSERGEMVEKESDFKLISLAWKEI